MGHRIAVVTSLGAAVALAASTGSAADDPRSEARPAPRAPSQQFRSRPDLKPPIVTVLKRARGTAPGYVFLAPKRRVAQAGPMIVDDRGRVVWFQPLNTRGVADFRAQRYRGRPVLTWWRGESQRGIGDGHYVILDSSYRTVATVTARNGLTGDIHEFLITNRNTALFTIYHRIPWDLSPLGGPKEGAIQEGVVQEVDIASGRVVFEWHSAPHVAPAESYIAAPPASRGAKADAYDYFHINSVDVDDDGGLLISARNTQAIYKIRRRDGAVVWRLGGKRSDFRLGRGARFAWQHDARRQPDGTLTLFDNGNQGPRGRVSRALVLRIDEGTRRVSVVRSYAHPKRLRSRTQGNAQFLPNGNVFVGWGSNPYFTEFDRLGRVLFDARFGRGADSYRAYRLTWTGLPVDRPGIALDIASDGGTTVYASWNGATEVVQWRLLAGDSPAGLAPVATVARSGFETAIRADPARYYAVEALGRRGQVLGTTVPRAVRTGKARANR
jgi:hypothetical protein